MQARARRARGAPFVDLLVFQFQQVEREPLLVAQQLIEVRPHVVATVDGLERRAPTVDPARPRAVSPISSAVSRARSRVRPMTTWWLQPVEPTHATATSVSRSPSSFSVVVRTREPSSTETLGCSLACSPFERAPDVILNGMSKSSSQAPFQWRLRV